MQALRDRQTVELLLNPDGQLWVERLGQMMECIGSIRPGNAQAILETVAGYLGKTITESSPLLEGEFPLDGSRFAGQIPPVVASPCFAIRKKAISIYTLDDYVSQGIMTTAQRAAISESVRTHKNILIGGGTGSGKTTLLNAVIHEAVEQAPLERFLIIEDTNEVQCAAPNTVSYHTSVDVDMTALVRTTLRMRPTRILVGEVRGREALDLLDVWNTGHPGGVATLHCNSAAEGLIRLRSLVSRNKDAPNEIEPLIGAAVHVVVQIARTPNGSRRVEEIISVSGYVDGEYVTDRI